MDDPDADVVVEVTDAGERGSEPGPVRGPRLPGTDRGGARSRPRPHMRVDLDGHLEPGIGYRYRSVHAGIASPVRRAGPSPRPMSPESLAFLLLTCQDYQNGYYGALAHAPARTSTS